MEPADLARHLLAAGPPSAAEARHWAGEAGRRAMAMLAYEDAAGWFAVAAGLAGEPAVRADLLLALGGVAFGQGDAAGARSAFARVIALEPASLEARVGLGWASLAAGRAEEAARVWRPLVGAVDDATTLDRMARLFAATGDRGAEARARARLKGAGTRP